MVVVDKNGRKRERTNAKCVELLDMNSNPIEVFPSGIAVATALGVQQGDINTEDQFEVMKRRKVEMAAAALLEPAEDAGPGNGRSRRISRGDYHVKVSDKAHAKLSKKKNQDVGPKLSKVVHIKVRKWEKKPCRVGTFQIRKWVPDVVEANPALQPYLRRRPDKRKSQSGRRTTVALQSRY